MSVATNYRLGSGLPLGHRGYGRSIPNTRNPRAVIDAAHLARDRSTALRLSSERALSQCRSVLDETLVLRRAGKQHAALVQQQVAGLKSAILSRAVIEQAKGLIMANVGCDAPHAFELLRAQSQHEHRKLRDVAAGLVDVVGHGGGDPVDDELAARRLRHREQPSYHPS